MVSQPLHVKYITAENLLLTVNEKIIASLLIFTKMPFQFLPYQDKFSVHSYKNPKLIISKFAVTQAKWYKP